MTTPDPSPPFPGIQQKEDLKEGGKFDKKVDKDWTHAYADDLRAFTHLAIIWEEPTIILLFLGETSELPTLRIATICFLSGVVCFLLALVCFLAETLLATRLLKFAEPSRPEERH